MNPRSNIGTIIDSSFLESGTIAGVHSTPADSNMFDPSRGNHSNPSMPRFNRANEVQLSHNLKDIVDETTTNRMIEIFGRNPSYNFAGEINLDGRQTLNNRLDNVRMENTRPEVPESRMLGKRQEIYNAINQYFPHFVMTKISQTNGLAVYKGIISCLMCHGTRYIIAISDGNLHSIGSNELLSNIKWKAFQTRWTENDKDEKKYSMSSHKYGKPGPTILDSQINMIKETGTMFLYECKALPLKIEIFKTKDTEYLSRSGTVSSAIEVFQTVLILT